MDGSKSSSTKRHLKPQRLKPLDETTKPFAFDVKELHDFDVPEMSASTALSVSKNPKFREAILPPVPKKDTEKEGTRKSDTTGRRESKPYLREGVLPGGLDARRIGGPSSVASSSHHGHGLPPTRNLRAAFLRDAFLGDRGAPMSEETMNLLFPASKTESRAEDHVNVPSDEELLADIVDGRDAVHFFSTIGKDGAVKFVYLNRSRTGEDFRPYDLTVVSRDEVDQEHFTMSATGVVHVHPGEPSEFMSLADWVRESTLFGLVSKIPFYKNFLIGKAFRSWRQNVRYKLYCRTREKLVSRFFLAKPTFVSTFMEVHALAVEMRSVNVLRIPEDKDHKAVSSDSFLDMQAQQRSTAAKSFEATVDKIEEILIKLCENVINRARAPDLSSDHMDLLTGTPGKGGADEDKHGRKKKKPKSMMELHQEEVKKVRAVKRAQLEAKMLGDFIRLVDHMVVSNLIGLTADSAANFHETLQLPKKVFSFLVSVNFGDDSHKTVLVPGESEILGIFVNTFEEIVNAINSVARILYMRSFKPYLAGKTVTTWHLGTTIRALPQYRQVVDACGGILRADFASASDYCNSLEPFYELYSFAMSWSIDEYSSKKRSVDEFRADFRMVNDAIRDVEKNIKMQHEAGNVYVDGKKLKNTLKPKLEEVLENMKQVLLLTARETCQSLIESFHGRVDRLGERPSQLHNFADFVDSFNHIRRESIEMRSSAEEVEKMFELLHLSDVKIPTEDQVRVDDLQAVVKEFLEASEMAQAHKDSSMQSMAVSLERSISQVNDDLLNMMTQLRSGDFVTVDADPKVVLEKLSVVKETINSLEEKANQFSSYEELFGLGQSTWDNLSDVTKQYEERLDLWQSLHDFNEMTGKWREIPFNTMDVEDGNKQLQIHLKKAFGLHKKFHDPISDLYSQSVQEWKEYIPIVLDLGNPAMRPRHWKRVFHLLNRPYQEDVTLDSLISYGAMDEGEAISDISAVASGEYSLELTLNKIKEGWDECSFILKNHREQKDVFIIAQIDEVMQQLEDDMVTLQTMLASRFVMGIKEEVEKWEGYLRLLQEVLDEWLTCQRNWMYLEFIFSSEDIQRQLPTESMKFRAVDKEWKEFMRKANANPNVLDMGTKEGVLDMFQHANKTLEDVQKRLEDYLETKRAAFPRFYFLSNDELLEILSQTREPRAVQPHLGKCFDNIKELEFKDEESDEITAMKSGEGEIARFTTPLFAEGNVEHWLLKVEENMRSSLYNIMKECLHAYSESIREEWFFDFPAQCVLAVDQVMWTAEVTEALKKVENGDDVTALKDYFNTYLSQIQNMVEIVRGKLTRLQRMTMGALIVLDVHCRDVVDRMVQAGCDSTNAFEWTMQLRYYWEETINNCIVKQANADFSYGYEYMGNQARLVITPLTDRCYLTCTGALHLRLGGAPQGPAGTGKTESVKDLAKALARQCVVFNCSDGLDYKMMGRMFSGLSQCGAWSCFDEFNRIDIEVLSVIAQQMLTIIQALLRNAEVFLFEGREIPLSPHFGVFITMNPGYAGRTELPDNLKALFRPVAMMIPDYALIGEIMLFSEGFSSAKSLAQKMVQLFKLSSEQLSKQDHYDFGMRAVKSILVMAGALKRAEPDLAEDIVLIRAMRDSNVPKFLEDDVKLFMAMIQDLFPGVEIPNIDYGVLQRQIEMELEDGSLIPVPSFVTKIIQLYEIMAVRHGVMVVGPTGSGKSVIIHTLQKALSALEAIDAEKYQLVRLFKLNPKSLTMGELYGEFNEISHEWTDGLVASIARQVVKDETEDRKWVVFDGPVDALWIENMNTVLDDNKMLCLVNGERIKLPPPVSMVFEVQDLAVASPATVSRCGMVYVEPSHLNGGWKPLVKKWKKKHESMYASFIERLEMLIMKYFETTIPFIEKECKQFIPAVPSSIVVSCMRMLEGLLDSESGFDTVDRSESEVHRLLDMAFLTAFTWSAGAVIDDLSKPKFDAFARKLAAKYCSDFPVEGSLFDFAPDFKLLKFVPWKELVPEFHYDSNEAFFNILVPTADTTRLSFVLEVLSRVGQNVLMTGVTGVGKTVIVQEFLRNRLNCDDPTGKYVSIYSNFSAQTSSRNLQDVLESKLEKKRKNLLGAPTGKRNIVFIDDLNMPALEQYGAQPPIELLRQMMDHGGFYDRQKLFFKNVSDTNVIACCGPPGGGRNPITPRLVRQFHVLSCAAQSVDSMRSIFDAILGGFLSGFTDEVRSLSSKLVSASVSLYDRVTKELLPTPSKSHYTFNLRDLSKLIQGMLMITPNNCPNPETLTLLWCHEACRVFCDRLVDDTDRGWFYDLIKGLLQKNLGVEMDSSVFSDVLFGDYQDRESRIYLKIEDHSKLAPLLQNIQEEYVIELNKQMDLVFFKDAIAHVSRLCRVLRQPRGNALLVGVGGSGRQSLTRLAAFIQDYKCFQIEITKSYGQGEFREDIKKVLLEAGCDDKPVVFLFSDTQIVKESFLEDINSVLNTGEIPNIFQAEDFERITSSVAPKVKAAGKMETRDGIYAHFLHLVRENLHVVLAMSPVGDAFRTRLRMFPALVNNCTIDWYSAWPPEALFSVAKRFLGEENLGTPEVNDALCNLCMKIHSSVSEWSQRFLREIRRHNYTTPTSYLELLELYKKIIGEQGDKIRANIRRLGGGLDKLEATNELVAGMKEDLRKLQPVLERSAKETEELLVTLTHEKKDADEMRKVCEVEERETAVIQGEAQELRDVCQRDLDEAMPAFHAAIAALETLNRQDITEIKSFATPPKLVQTVMEAVCVLKGVKPSWENATKMIADTKFLASLIAFDKDNIPQSILKKLKKYIADEDFVPETVAKVSKAAKSLCMWVRAIDTYAAVAKKVEPKKAKLAEAEEKLAFAEAKLKEKQDALASVMKRIAELQATFDEKQKQKEELEAQMKATEVRLERANKLVIGLGDEKNRWRKSTEQLGVLLTNLVGNIAVAAGFIAYLGPFTNSYRVMMMKEWIQEGKRTGIPISEDYSLRKISDPVVEREWFMKGLPADDFSVENAILLSRGRRWPLMIDPQGQANTFVKNLERENGMKVIKLTDGKFLQTLENCIRIGTPCLLENVGETLDPALEPVLLKQTFKKGGQLVMRLGDSDVPYSQDFRFYITTKLPNPHFMPELSIKVTIINFTVTVHGLEDQLLAHVVGFERPELEQQKDSLIVQIADGQKQLKEIEDKILQLLANASGDILEDEVLINTLAASKKTSNEINKRVKEAEETAVRIDIARNEYRPVAKRGSLLYFVIADMSDIDPMYQNSLAFFIQLFHKCLENSERSKELAVRLKTLLDTITENTYVVICRGLFEKDKIVLSMLVAMQILRGDGVIKDEEWSYFLRGSGLSQDYPFPPKPYAWLPDGQWRELNGLSIKLPGQYDDIAGHFASHESEWKSFHVSEAPHLELLPEPFESSLSSFEKLLLLRVLRPEKVLFGVSKLVSESLGPQFSESPPFDLMQAFKDSSEKTPIVFVLSPGADPAALFINFARDMGFSDRLQMLSLGQGQGPIAERLIEQGMKSGEWVCLQNCHLAASWMSSLEKIVESFGHEAMNPDFRLWLTSMPSKDFPVPVLQASIKLTNEPPKGLKANVRRSFAEVIDGYEETSKPLEWKKLLFGLAFFHGVIQERRKFGPLGWNIPYDWNDSDLSASVKSLKNYLEENEVVPWETLKYVIGVINYGGRVTDFLDLRCVESILRKYYTPGILEDEFRLSDDGVYHAPPVGGLDEVRTFLSNLPAHESPATFGLHENANITFQQKETDYLLDTVISVQPRTSVSGGGKSSDEIVFDLANDMLSRIPGKIDTAKSHPSAFAVDRNGVPLSLSTVLAQEVDHFNNLLYVISRSLTILKKAVKGLEVMSAEMEEMYSAFLFQRVPTRWADAAYPSLKPLGPWVLDLIRRVEFFQDWVSNGTPKVFWLSGLHFPQGFLTAVLQRHARQFQIPIDTLRFRAVLQQVYDEGDVPEAPKTGIYVSGLFMEGARWDPITNGINESKPGELYTHMPIMWLDPEDVSKPIPDDFYQCPLYKTATRAGALSTTGLSTNFVLSLPLSSQVNPDHWILRGVAMLCALPGDL